MKQGARDFRTGTTIDIHTYHEDAIEIYHIFPRAWCMANGIPEGQTESVVNKTPIDGYTNRLIGAKSPSGYLKTVEAEAEISEHQLDAILRSHEIDPLSLRKDDFNAFYRHPFERLVKTD